MEFKLTTIEHGICVAWVKGTLFQMDFLDKTHAKSFIRWTQNKDIAEINSSYEYMNYYNEWKRECLNSIFQLNELGIYHYENYRRKSLVQSVIQIDRRKEESKSPMASSFPIEIPNTY